MLFKNRTAAGRRLAARLKGRDLKNPLCMALPRGGVPVGFEVARELRCPLEILVVRKIGAPGYPEFGVGALAEDQVLWLDADTLARHHFDRSSLQPILEMERKELERRVRKFRGSRPMLPVQDREVILIDDGLATGSTATVGARFLKAHGARHVILAIPVGSRESVDRLASECDEIICLETPEPFFAVGPWYEDFAQTSDDEVLALLDASRKFSVATDSDYAMLPPVDEETKINASGVLLPAQLSVPLNPAGVVVFAHGSGSSRMSPRNQQVASELRRSGLGTLLLDLLSATEARDRTHVFDISLLASRLGAAVTWAAAHPELSRHLPIALFGASTGAAAALRCASQYPNEVAAVVSRGGRVDLAFDSLSEVKCPVLLIVGELDVDIMEANLDAQSKLKQHGIECEIQSIAGAGHLFEEKGALDKVAQHASRWLARKCVSYGLRAA